ncbi:MAG: hypothetical protein U0796_11320 [Gemmatales bacterium]
MTQSILRRLLPWSVLPAGVVILGLATLQPVSLAQEGAAPGSAGQAEMENGQQVLTRGPIHEAFGQPTVFNPKPGLAITKKPPQPVEELPPDEKPEGDNVAWIGGYWSYDEEKTDFMWVSGFWRVLPPGRQWMPGYWNDNAGQYQWVSGYWANAEQQEQQVVEQAPPDSLEQGAPPTAPSEEHIWAPGCWVYRDTRYLWRPGYWVVNQPGWCWVPDCYTWTPGGYVYVAGYWDWSIRRRGILFAPCYFDPVVVYRPGYYYRPTVCLDIDVITPHFFCRPAYGHYYFGDYYATSYLSIGITPWFNFTYARGSRFYSSDFSYYECHYRRTNPRWGIEVRVGYERYRDNVNLRPARTYVNQQTVINNITINNNKTTIINNNTNNLALAKPIKTYTANMAKDNNAPMKFEKINDTQARNFSKTAVETRNLTQERAKVERNLAAAAKTGSTAGGSTAIRNVTMPKSPILSKMSSNNTVETGKTNVGGIGGNVTRTPPALPGGSSTAGKVAGTTGTAGAGTKTGPITGGTGAGSKTMGGSTGSGSTGTVGAGSKVGGTGSTAGSKTGESGSTGTKTSGGSSTGSSGTGSKVGGSSSTGSGSKVGGSTGSSGAGSKSGGSSSGSGSPSKGSGGSSSSGSSGGNSKKDKDKP